MAKEDPCRDLKLAFDAVGVTTGGQPLLRQLLAVASSSSDQLLDGRELREPLRALEAPQLGSEVGLLPCLLFGQLGLARDRGWRSVLLTASFPLLLVKLLTLQVLVVLAALVLDFRHRGGVLRWLLALKGQGCGSVRVLQLVFATSPGRKQEYSGLEKNDTL